MPKPKTVDEKIASLVEDVDENIRQELQLRLNTLRNSGDYTAVLASMSRLGLLFCDQIFEKIGMKRFKDDLYKCILRLSIGDDKDIKGLNELPMEIATWLYPIRITSNKIDHAIEKSPPSTEKAEIALSSYLIALKWFYCEYEKGSRLPTIYKVEASKHQLPQKERVRKRKEGNQAIIGTPFKDISRFFKDREREIFTLNKFLKDEAVKFICVVGRGGIGKTALLSKICNEIESGDLRISKDKNKIGVDGLIYMDCQSSENITVEKIVANIVQLLGASRSQILESQWMKKGILLQEKIQILLRFISREIYLIAFDNFERLLNKEGKIADNDLQMFFNECLKSFQGIKIIMASREPLLIEGESIHTARTLTLEGIPEDEGIALLRALDTDSKLGLNDAPLELLRKAVQRCFGFPRALEKIAGILASDLRLDLSTLLGNDALFKGEVVENLTKEHYRRVNDEDRRVLETIAVYNEAVPVAAIKYVLDINGPDIDVNACLRSLPRKKFVTTERGSGLYELHPMDQHSIYTSIQDKQALHKAVAEYYRTQFKDLTKANENTNIIPHIRAFYHLKDAEDYDEAMKVVSGHFVFLLWKFGRYDELIALHTQLLGKITSEELITENHYILGETYVKACQWESAISRLQNALAYYRQTGNKDSEAMTLLTLANSHVAIGQYQKAIEYVNDAQQIFELLQDQTGIGGCLNEYGVINFHINNFNEALDYFNQSLKLARELGRKVDEGTALCWIGRAYLSLKQYQEALPYLEKSLEIAKESDDWEGEMEVLGDLGELHRRLKNTEETIKMFSEAFSLALGKLQSHYIEKLLDNLVEVCLKAGESKWLTSSLKSLLRLRRRDEFTDTILLDKLAELYRGEGHFIQAARCHEKRLELFRELDSHDMVPEILCEIGWDYASTGKKKKALKCFDEALKMNDEVNDERGKYKTLQVMACIHNQWGLKKEAIKLSNKTLSIARKLEDRILEGIELLNLGMSYLEIGETQKAEECYERILMIADEIGNRQFEIESLQGIGNVKIEEREIDKAINEYYKRSLELAKEGEDERTIALNLLHIGYAHLIIGNLKEARLNFEEAIKFSDIQKAFVEFVKWGILCLSEGDIEKAREYFKQCISSCQSSLKKQQDSYETLYALGIAQVATGKINDAKATFHRALEICSAKGVVSQTVRNLNLIKRASPNLEGLQEAISLLENHFE